MKTVSGIIERLGGTSFVASAMFLTPSTVSSWKTSGRVPAWRRPGLIAVAEKKGIPLSDTDISAATQVAA
jgi:hypothetical protein